MFHVLQVNAAAAAAAAAAAQGRKTMAWID